MVRGVQHGFYAEALRAHPRFLFKPRTFGTISVTLTSSALLRTGVVKTFRYPHRDLRMQYQYADFEFAMCALRILVIVGVVAIISYAAKSRAMFVAGALGSLLGCVAPHGGIHINGTAEAVYMGQLHFTASNIFWWGIIGATFGCLAVAGIQRFKPTSQYSLSALIATMTVIAIVLGLLQIANR